MLRTMIFSGSPLDYLFAFAGGVLISFTPCVYPLIPVSAAYIGAKGSDSRLKGLALSLTYVSGIAVTYSILGLLASLTGKMFGLVSSHPLTYITVGVLIVIFGLSMLDIFYIALPNLVRLPRFKKQNYFSTFLIGMVSGLIIGPCTAPALGAILTYLAAKKNIFYGITLLFSFAYGMGLVLIIAGTFSSMFLSLPKSGQWMLYIKRICAVILMITGLCFLFTGIRRM